MVSRTAAPNVSPFELVINVLRLFLNYFSTGEEPQTKLRSGGQELRRISICCVRRQQSRKELWIVMHRAKHPCANTRIAAKPKHQVAHEHRTARKFAMSALVLRQVICRHGIGQRKRLPERQTQPVAGDGIHAARSVTEQCNVIFLYVAQRPHGGDSASFPAAQRRAGKFFSKCRHFVELCFKQSGRGCLRHHNHANFLLADRSHVCLSFANPMDFHAARPGLDAEMAAARIALPDATRRFQADPTANARALSIRANDPCGTYISLWKLYATGANTGNNAGDRRLPEKLHATFFRTGDQTFMQHWPAQTNSLPARKIRGNLHAILNKSDAAKALPGAAVELHA